jgi:hypothetical protein
MAIFDYIEVFENQRRRHFTLGQVSPAVFERRTAVASSDGGGACRQLHSSIGDDGNAANRPSTFFGH